MEKYWIKSELEQNSQDAQNSNKDIKDPKDPKELKDSKEVKDIKEMKPDGILPPIPPATVIKEEAIIKEVPAESTAEVIKSISSIPIEAEKGDLSVKDDPFSGSILALTQAIIELTKAIQSFNKNKATDIIKNELKDQLEKGEAEIEVPKIGETVSGFKTRMKFTDKQFNEWITTDSNVIGEKFINNLTDESWRPYLEFIKVLSKLKAPIIERSKDNAQIS